MKEIKDGADYLIDLSEEIEKDLITLNSIVKRWDKYMEYYLKKRNFNNSAISTMIDWGRDGGHNWVLLHWEEKYYKIYLKKFAREIHYCSDRMSMDRLLRCHWLLNATIDNYVEDNIGKEI